MATPIGTWTFGQIISDIRTRLKTFTDEFFPKKLIRSELNRCISELHELGGTKDDPVYRTYSVLTAAGSQGGFVALSSGCTYTNTTKSVYIPTAQWVGGAFSTYITSATALPIGTIVIFYLPAGGDNIWASTIESITDATHFILKDAYGSNLGTSDFQIAVLCGDTTTDSIDISGIGDYKVIDKITSIEDSVTGLCLEMSQKDFQSIKQYGSVSNYTDDILWYREGERIHFYKGSNVTAYGTRTMYYTRMPVKGTLDADYIDVRDSNVGMIIDMVMLKVLQTVNAPIPSALAGTNEKLMIMKKSGQEELAKQYSNQKTQ
jgi:hypothetical protein